MKSWGDFCRGKKVLFVRWSRVLLGISCFSGTFRVLLLPDFRFIFDGLIR
ncbi:hypothetical protein ADIS_1569 [Lunatimonas lonarensis]|uniref:Uncharacterized protein n=1 Tax=Lunatimonas lonarensis TaxID=1232681 RepID=R7ZV69_9BACT|nr:hypothetical protein ADIS_1569 [Lunatimonas lonarensis]